jgi:pimeloyl-ACP methyl ester carboxylesterase
MQCLIDDLPLHYDDLGEGRPILFLHGWTMDRRDERLDYERVLAARPGWRRLYLDLPGMGETPARPWIHDMDGFLDVILRFIDQVLPGERFSVAGCSAGGYLALGVAHRLGDRLDGLHLRAPKILADPAERTVPTFCRLIEDPDLMAGLDPAARTDLSEALIQRPNYLAAYERKQRDHVRPGNAAADLGFLDPIRLDPRRYGFSFDIEHPPEPCLAPALIITGRQDIVTGYRDAWRIIENYPRASFAVLDRADHGLPIQHDRLFDALVEDWLDRVAEMAARFPA